MADVVIVTYPAHKGGAKREEIGIAGVYVPFTRTVLSTGRVVMRAEVEAGSRVHRACAANGVFTVMSPAAGAALDDALAAISGPKQASVESPVRSGVPAIVESVRRNGWDYPDVTGAGEGNVWDERGGRGERSGLTMAELALCVPPPGWFSTTERATEPEPGQRDPFWPWKAPGLCDTHWPWEVPGFAAPGLAWRPPVLKLKRKLADEAPPVDESPQPVPSDLAETDLGEAGSLEPGPAPVDEGASKPRRAPRKPPETRTEEVLVDVAPERQETAIQKLLSLWTADNQAPSLGKAGHALKKSGLDLTKAQVEALLNLAGARARAVTAP